MKKFDKGVFYKMHNETSVTNGKYYAVVNCILGTL